MPTQSISMPLPTDGGTVIILPLSCITMLKLRISKKLAKSLLLFLILNLEQKDLHNLNLIEPRVDLTALKAPFLLEEIKRATFELGADKTLGQDSFPIFFIQKF